MCGEVSLFSGELALPLGVACVSRLIGNSDITANPCGWQAAPSNSFRSLAGAPISEPVNPPAPRPKRKKRHSYWSGASLYRAGHWPPKHLRTVYLTVPAAEFPAGLPFQGPLEWRILLPDLCFSLGWQDSSHQPVHHWHSSISTLCAKPIILVFQSLGDSC